MQRDITFDIMKGIGIILMFVGHLRGIGVIHQLIYSFHIPMFMFLAGYMAKPVMGGNVYIRTVLKNFKRLILPILVTYVIIGVYLFLIGLIKGDLHSFYLHVIRFVWLGIDPIKTPWGDIQVSVLWFPLALFSGKTLMQLIGGYSIKWLLILGLLFTILGMTLHFYVTTLPWCISQGLVASIFVAIGMCNQKSPLPKWVKWITAILWLIWWPFSRTEMAYCSFRCLPIDIIAAYGATVILYYLCKILSKVKYLSSILAYFGYASLAILCMHELVDWSDIVNTIFIHSPFAELRNEYLIFTTIRFGLIISLGLIVTKIPYLKKIYC